MMDLCNYVGGEFVCHSGEDWMHVLEPATGQRFARVPLSTAEDVDTAVAAAREAQPAWSSLSISERPIL